MYSIYLNINVCIYIHIICTRSRTLIRFHLVGMMTHHRKKEKNMHLYAFQESYKQKHEVLDVLVCALVKPQKKLQLWTGHTLPRGKDWALGTQSPKKPAPRLALQSLPAHRLTFQPARMNKLRDVTLVCASIRQHCMISKLRPNIITLHKSQISPGLKPPVVF